jgi:UDP-N-acetylglucosamine/UDP-N-acetylgalactosamine diphosphorylase
MTTESYETLLARYQAAGQGHVFAFWDQLTDEEKSRLLEQLAQFRPETVNEIAKQTFGEKAEPANGGEVIPLPAKVCASVVNGHTSEQAGEWRRRGLELIGAGKVGVVLLAGGQGTRLGSSLPKGCYDVGLPSGKTLFQLQAERIRKIAELAKSASGGSDVVVPWYIMTSGPTVKPTREFFETHNYFGLDRANVVFFEQGVMPCLTRDGKIILETKGTVAVAPDGNGGIYRALHIHGVLDDMKRRGIEHIHTYCVDNCLVRVADPVFIGFAASRGVDIATKVVRKRDAAESVGLIVSKGGRPGVVEYSEISDDLARATEDSDEGPLLKFRAANIVNHYYSFSFLERIPTWESEFLPFHVANKKIPCVDIATGEVVKPTSPNGIKLEQFVFDVFPNLEFDKFACLEVARDREFSPLKNGPGTKVDNPETSRRDVLAESARWLRVAGASPEHDVEVSPLTSYAGEGLTAFAGKVIAAGTVV